MNNQLPERRGRRSAVQSVMIVTGSLVLLLALGSFGALFLFPDAVYHRIITPRITEAFAAEYPGASLDIARIRYNVFRNQFSADDVTIRTADSAVVIQLRGLAVAGIGWVSLLFGAEPNRENIRQGVFEAVDVRILTEHPRYSFRCSALRLSVPDSSIRFDSLSIAPDGDDEEFFAQSPYRTTRYRALIPAVSVTGAHVLPLVLGDAYRIRSVRMQDPQIDILVNKDKTDRPGTDAGPMPGELLASIREETALSDIRISNASLVYGERFSIRGTPAVILLDSLQITGTGIANRGTFGNTIVLSAEGRFMRSAPVMIEVSMPAASPEYSLKYRGTLGRMDVAALNIFLERAEQVRARGRIDSAEFDFEVFSGRASGDVHIIYQGLSLAFIDARSGSEHGLSDLFTSFIANTFTIRSNNSPGRSGGVNIGRISYARTSEDPFFRFSWFALRSGVRDIVGF